MRLKDLTGKRYGYLQVRQRAGIASSGEVKWLCVCTCGQESVVTSSNLRRGHTSSCGCRGPMRDRFWDHVVRAGDDECWDWKGALDKDGYGHFHHPGEDRWVCAHRIAWELHHGNPAPDEMKVCHTCDRPRCMNPAHLFVGTQGDNVRDMCAKGRWRCKRRLSQEEEKEILQRLENPYHGSVAELSRKYGVGPGVIQRVRKRATIFDEV